MSFTQRNHYVPQWYQRRFLPAGVFKFHFLDLQPAKVTNEKTTHSRRHLLHWGPKRCFYFPNLYTIKLGNYASDFLEKRFFGPIDAKGEKAVEFMANYRIDNFSGEAFQALMTYMDAQRLRTPRGLDWLRTVLRVHDHNSLLVGLQAAQYFHTTMWTEAEWEIVRATKTPTKFLISDGPVTFYNHKVFPLSPKYPYPLDADVRQVGTRTIFPLGLDRCLILTHSQFLREPDVNPTRMRTNARGFDRAFFDLRKIQTDRELDEDEVLRINYIIKRRATRYLAAANVDWLFPERTLKNQNWSKLDDDWFLWPNPYKVTFSGGMVIGYNDGSSYATDEYGRRPFQKDYNDEKQRDREFRAAQETKLAWARKRQNRSIARNYNDFNDAADRILAADLKQLQKTSR